MKRQVSLLQADQDNSNESRYLISSNNLSSNENSGDEVPASDSEDLQFDGGSFGWVIVGAAYIMFFVTGSILKSKAMFYPEYMEAFNVDSETVGWILSLAGATQGISSLFCGPMVDKYGSRKVCLVGCLLQSLGVFLSSLSPNIYLPYITYTLLWGPGLGIIFTAGPVIIQKWFSKSRSLAHSLAIMGVPTGVIASGPLTYVLIETYCWRGALLIYSAIGLHGVVSSSLFRPPPITLNSETKAKNKETTFVNRRKDTESWEFIDKIVDLTLFMNPAFLLFALARSLANFGFVTNQTELLIRAMTVGMPRHQVQYLPIFMGVCGVLGTIVSGSAGRRGDRAFLTGVGMSLHGVGQVLIGFTGDDFLWNTICTSFSNFMIGFALALEPTLLTDIVGLHRLGRAYGLYNLILSISTLTAAPFSGWMYDISGNYNIPFYVTGIFAIIAGGLMFVVTFLHSFYAKSTEN